MEWISAAWWRRGTSVWLKLSCTVAPWYAVHIDQSLGAIRIQGRCLAVGPTPWSHWDVNNHGMCPFVSHLNIAPGHLRSPGQARDARMRDAVPTSSQARSCLCHGSNHGRIAVTSSKMNKLVYDYLFRLVYANVCKVMGIDNQPKPENKSKTPFKHADDT